MRPCLFKTRMCRTAQIRPLPQIIRFPTRTITVTSPTHPLRPDASGQGGVSGRHFGHGARRNLRGHAQSAGRHESSPACRPRKGQGAKARSATPPAFFVADLRGEPGCQKLTFYPASRTEKQQTPAPCRRSSSPCAEKIRPSCQGAQNAGPMFTPAPASTVRIGQRRRSHAPPPWASIPVPKSPHPRPDSRPPWH